MENFQGYSGFRIKCVIPLRRSVAGTDYGTFCCSQGKQILQYKHNIFGSLGWLWCLFASLLKFAFHVVLNILVGVNVLLSCFRPTTVLTGGGALAPPRSQLPTPMPQKIIVTSPYINPESRCKVGICVPTIVPTIANSADPSFVTCADVPSWG